MSTFAKFAYCLDFPRCSVLVLCGVLLLVKGNYFKTNCSTYILKYVNFKNFTEVTTFSFFYGFVTSN